MDKCGLIITDPQTGVFEKCSNEAHLLVKCEILGHPAVAEYKTCADHAMIAHARLLQTLAGAAA